MKNPVLLIVPALALFGFGLGSQTAFGAIPMAAIGGGIGCLLILYAYGTTQ